MELFQVSKYLDVEHTIAKYMFDPVENPWEVLPSISIFIEQLGPMNLSSAAVMYGSQNQQSLHRPLISAARVSSMQARKSVTAHLSVAVRSLAKTA